MHQYLKSIGFSKMNRRELNDLLDEAIEFPDSYEEIVDQNKDDIVEMRCSVGSDMGISIFGNYDRRGMFHVEHYKPYYDGQRTSREEERIGLVRLTGSEQYQGIYFDKNYGTEMIFSVNNVMDILKGIQMYGVQKSKGHESEMIGNHVKGLSVKTSVAYSALALDGKIIMPMYKTSETLAKQRVAGKEKEKLIDAANDGDVDAMQELSIREMNSYQKAVERLEHEDLLSIVTTYCIPTGIESDQYEFMGEILYCVKVENMITMEPVWQLRVNCNDIVIDIAINEKDLMGIPAVGRRVKGQIWLQGRLMDF